MTLQWQLRPPPPQCRSGRPQSCIHGGMASETWGAAPRECSQPVARARLACAPAPRRCIPADIQSAAQRGEVLGNLVAAACRQEQRARCVWEVRLDPRCAHSHARVHASARSRAAACLPLLRAGQPRAPAWQRSAPRSEPRARPCAQSSASSAIAAEWSVTAPLHP